MVRAFTESLQGVFERQCPFSIHDSLPNQLGRNSALLGHVVSNFVAGLSHAETSPKYLLL